MGSIKQKCVLCFLVILTCTVLTGCASKRDLEQYSTEIAYNYLKLYRDPSSIESINEINYPKNVDIVGVKEDFSKFLNELNERDKGELDVDSFYNAYYKVENEADCLVGGMWDVDDIRPDNSEYINYTDEEEEFVDDSRIKYGDKNTVAYSDLKFSDGIDVIAYKGSNMVVTKDDIIETYEMLKINPKYTFKYINLKWGNKKDYIDVQFKSVYDTSYKEIVRIAINKHKIVGVKLRG